jgi:hypothetical protein
MVRILLAVAALACAAAPVRASGTPMDEARWSSWIASDIVVADSTGKVLEVWKGTALKVGDALPVDNTDFRLRLPQVVQHGGAFGSKIEGTKVHADRVILFLHKTPKNSPDLKPEGSWQGLYPMFVSAGAGGVYAQVYALEKDGTQHVYAVSKTEAEFKKEYLPIAERRTALDAALALPDAAKRAEALKPFATSGQRGQSEALEALPECGAHGVGPLAAALFDADANTKQFHGERARESAIRGLLKVGKPAGGELTKFFEKQLAFWKQTGPELRDGWYNGVTGPEGVQLRLLLNATESADALAVLPTEGRAAARELLKLWADTPALASVKTAGDLHPAKALKAAVGVWDAK